jgi:hypothetical protein
MSEVFIFPDRMERQWRVFEADMRSALADLGCDRDTVNATARNLKPVFMRHAREERFSIDQSSPEAGLAALNDWVRRLATGLLVEVALREAELYRLRGAVS